MVAGQYFSNYEARNREHEKTEIGEIRSCLTQRDSSKDSSSKKMRRTVSFKTVYDTPSGERHCEQQGSGVAREKGTSMTSLPH